MSNKETLMSLISKVLETKIDNQSSINNTENWDSLNHVKLILEIQNEFNIKIPFDKISQLTSVDLISKFINSKL